MMLTVSDQLFIRGALLTEYEPVSIVQYLNRDIIARYSRFLVAHSIPTYNYGKPHLYVLTLIDSRSTYKLLVDIENEASSRH